MEPIKFDNVEPVLSGTKTGTWRMIKPQPRRVHKAEVTWYCFDEKGHGSILEPKYKPGEVYPIVQTDDTPGELECEKRLGAEPYSLGNGAWQAYLNSLPHVKIISATPVQVKDITEEMAEKAGHENRYERSYEDNICMERCDEAYRNELHGIYPDLTGETWGWWYDLELAKEGN